MRNHYSINFNPVKTPGRTVFGFSPFMTKNGLFLLIFRLNYLQERLSKPGFRFPPETNTWKNQCLRTRRPRSQQVCKNRPPVYLPEQYYPWFCFRIWFKILGSLIFSSSAKSRIFARTSAVRGSSSANGRKIRPRVWDGTARMASIPTAF